MGLRPSYLSDFGNKRDPVVDHGCDLGGLEIIRPDVAAEVPDAGRRNLHICIREDAPGLCLRIRLY